METPHPIFRSKAGAFPPSQQAYLLAPETTRDITGLNENKVMPDVKGSMPAPAPADAHPARPTETPKDLKKRVRGLDKSLTNVHERLVQTEKQIFDLERSYLEETRLYGNVLQGWDAYLDIKGKGTGDNILSGSKRGGRKREAPAADDAEAEEGEDEIGEREAYWIWMFGVGCWVSYIIPGILLAAVRLWTALSALHACNLCRPCYT